MLDKIKRTPDQTREAILDRAVSVIHAKGFQAASLSDILADTGLTRGALYHHFPNKQALGLAALERIEQMVRSDWLEPLANCDDPIDRLVETMYGMGMSLGPDDILAGCPLNNLAQEMSLADEEFRSRAASIYYQWRLGVAQALEQGQRRGKVRAGADPMAAATFFVGALAGGRGLAKVSRSPEPLEMVARELAAYLETLRP
jgi:TetR/AcrR family transcriptional regulator, transcriptional repressor for nem operon